MPDDSDGPAPTTPSKNRLVPWIAIGAVLGAAVGSIFDELGLGLALGLASGLIIGALLSRRKKIAPDAADAKGNTKKENAD